MNEKRGGCTFSTEAAIPNLSSLVMLDATASEMQRCVRITDALVPSAVRFLTGSRSEKCMYIYHGAFVHLEETPKTAETASGEFVINSLGPVLCIRGQHHS